jgi:hypothetical protein
MVTRVNDLSSEFRRVSKMQVVQTTRQIILENVRLNNQMGLIETDYNGVEAKNGTIRDEVIYLIIQILRNYLISYRKKVNHWNTVYLMNANE